MGRFIITEEFWELFPQAEIAIVLTKGITNREAFVKNVRTEINELLERSDRLMNEEGASKILEIDILPDNY